MWLDVCYTVTDIKNSRKKCNKMGKEKENSGRAKKRLLRFLFSRIGIILLLIIVQVGILLAMTKYLQQYMFYVHGGMAILGTIVVIAIINSEGNPAFKMTWMLCVMVSPPVGTLAYLYVQCQIGTKWMGKRLSDLKEETSKYMIQEPSVIQELRETQPEKANLAHYLSNYMKFPIYKDTQAQYFPVGEKKFEAMLKEIEKAENFIFMEYFIIERGVMWNTLLDLLTKKAEEGVEVRVMYDGMCAISKLPYDYPKEVRKRGIQCKMSIPIKPFLSTVQNNRDHRKICVIDGKVGFTGGVNLADEYINQIERFGHWKDTAIMLKGDAVQSLTMMFLEMWNIDEKNPENYRNYITTKGTGLYQNAGYILPYADSPFDNENVGEEVYFHILNHSKKYVHIMTPYLILDNEMITTLTRTAKSGIEVIIIMPHIPDKWYAFVLAKTYYKELIKAGVKIYEYTPGFVHAKVFVSDDDTATVGTINLDYRSLYLHFECGAMIYNNSVVKNIEEDFQDTLAKCQRVTLQDVKDRDAFTKISGEVLKLFAPLM